MLVHNSNIIESLKREVLALNGFKSIKGNGANKIHLGPIDFSFPDRTFPLSAVHEFMCDEMEDISATAGFISFLLSSLTKNNAASVWIGSSSSLFPPALKAFGTSADHIIFIKTKNQKEILWAMEEALKCEGLAAVVATIRELSFMESRRLQLAAEQSRVTGIVIRERQRSASINACVSRWKISHLKSAIENGLPGIGHPRWQIELLKIRNGKPGSWQGSFVNGKLEIETKKAVAIPLPQRNIV